MHKLDRYYRRFTNDYVISNRSRYYNMGNHILRVSDHIAHSSSGLFSIIIKDNCYLLHHPSSGSVEVMNYEQIKGFVKIFALFPLGNMMQTNNWEMAKGETVVIKEEQVGNVPLSVFSKNQQQTIREFMSQRIACRKLVL